MKVEGFDWDAGNEFKNEETRGITREAIETFFRGQIRVAPDVRHSNREERFLAIGMAVEGRPMIVAFTLRTRADLTLIRPISARHMHEKEARRYEQAFAKNED